MKAIMVMFDSLNRHMLPPYGCDWIQAPNFTRLAERTVAFDNCYVGSMPCMPARRELHTGRYNFLHRSWGPLEPYDDSMPEILKNNGVYTHLVSDHWHYWEAGGANYHTKYNSFEWVRGQEGDGWKGNLTSIEIPDHIDGKQGLWGRQDWINRMHMANEEEHCIAKTFAKGMEFIETNHACDQWFLQLEAFDPHEPFYSSQRFKDIYPHDYDGPVFDWPSYHKVRETRTQSQHCIYEYAALLSMCDHYLGKVFDMMDRHNMWDDTMLIVNTDHGFLLGEHDWWGKVIMPFYNEIAHTPLFIWDPRTQKCSEHRNSLVQTIDLAPTLLDYFGQSIPEDMEGKVLQETISSDQKVRDYGLFGIHGGHTNITDGRYVYMRAADVGILENDRNLCNYVLMPQHIKKSFSVEELATAELRDGFSFAKGCKLLKVHGGVKSQWAEIATNKEYPYTFPAYELFDGGHMLFDLKSDPNQSNPIDDREIEKRMIKGMVDLMEANDAPSEQYVRMGLEEKQGVE